MNENNTYMCRVAMGLMGLGFLEFRSHLNTLGFQVPDCPQPFLIESIKKETLKT